MSPCDARTPAGLVRELLLWTFFAAIVRAVFFMATPQVIDSADSILYLDAAGKIAEGRFSDVYPRIPLLYPILTAAGSFLARDLELAGLVVSLIAMTLLVPVLFLLSHALHGRDSARIVAVVASLWPWLVDYGCRVAPESIYALLWFVSAGLLILAVRRGGGYPYALAIALLLLYLARPEGILIAVAALACGLLLRKDEGAKILQLAPAVILLAVAIPVHLIFVKRLAAQAGVTPRMSVSSLGFVLDDWGWTVTATGLRLLLTTIPIMLGPVLLLLLVPGMFARLSAWRDARAERVVQLLAGAQLCAAALSTFAEPRYVMTAIVALSLWSSRGTAVIADRFAQSTAYARLRHAPVIVIALMMVVGLLANILPPFFGKMSYRPLEYKLAGNWMHEHLAPGLILSRKPQMGYYAGMPTTGPAPEDSIEDIHARVLDAGARYVVVDARYSTEMIPAMKPLLEPANAPNWLRVLNADLSPYPEARIVVYEVVEKALAR